MALQGAFALHVEACTDLGYDAIEVRTAAQLDAVDRIIIPGGESTTMSMMLDRNALREPLAERLAAGMPAFGTCAGMILLATDVADGRPDQKSFAAIDIGVKRNGYGRQNQSFSDNVLIERIENPDQGFHAVFIRAPRGGTGRARRRGACQLRRRSGLVSAGFDTRFGVSSRTVARPAVTPLFL